MKHTDVVIVGAGQAGLATSYWLAERGFDHVLLERDRPGASWLDRWDSFCLVTPNWTLDLPGFPYDGDDPDGFLLRNAIADYVQRYRDWLNAPVHESTQVQALSRTGRDWTLQTSRGEWSARAVVVATGAFPFPSIPSWAADLESDLLQLHSQDYRRPSDLPGGGVLVVGSGQSGAQIVDDLTIADRQVWFSIGQAGHVNRRYRGRDTNVWLKEIGFMEMAVTDEMRQRPSMMVSGRDGGKDLNLRVFGRDGVHLLGRVVGVDRSTLTLVGNIADTLDGADAVAVQVRDQIDRYISEHAIKAPAAVIEAIDWVPEPAPLSLDLQAEGITTVIWATGYRHDYSWIDAAIFDERGYPRQHRGVTDEPGLYFIGLHGMHTVGSGLFSGVGADAKHIVEHLARTLN